MKNVTLLKEERKAQVLKPPAFGCLKKIPSINITRGCAFSCVYCYARGFTNAPRKGEVYYYHNLLELLNLELEGRYKRGRLPQWVTFSTTSDPFQPFEETLNITYKVMETLLKNGIGVSFITKGYIPDDFINLFSSYPQRVSARIGICSLREEYKGLFEPFSSLPKARLKNIRRLIESGIEVAVRIDPIIPGVTDSRGDVEGLLQELARIGVKEVSISYLVMRPFLRGQFLRELPFKLARSILKLYHTQPYQRVITSAKTRLLPMKLRERGYKMIKDIAEGCGIACLLCGCKNPDMKWEFCSPWVERKGLEEKPLPECLPSDLPIGGLYQGIEYSGQLKLF